MLVLPDPVNKVNSAGRYDQTGEASPTGIAGPGFASVNERLVLDVQAASVPSRRSTNKVSGASYWEVDIKYNPLTKAEFEPLFAFTEKNKTFYVALPQYATPQDSGFNASTEKIYLVNDASAGDTSIVMGGYTLTGSPRPGDMFNLDYYAGYTQAHRVTRVETTADYETAGLTATQRRVHFTPPLAKDVSIGRGTFKTTYVQSQTTSGAFGFFTSNGGPFYPTEKIRVIGNRSGTSQLGTNVGQVYYTRTYNPQLFPSVLEDSNTNLNTSIDFGMNDIHGAGGVFITDYDIFTDTVTANGHGLSPGDELLAALAWREMPQNTAVLGGYHLNVKSATTNQFVLYNQRTALSANPVAGVLNVEFAYATGGCVIPTGSVVTVRDNIYPYTITEGLDNNTRYYAKNISATTIELYTDRALTSKVTLRNTVGCGLEFEGIIAPVTSGSNTITLTSHGLLEGMILVPDVLSGCTTPAGLTNGTSYFIKTTPPSTITLWTNAVRDISPTITAASSACFFRVRRHSAVVTTSNTATTVTVPFSSGMQLSAVSATATSVIKAKLSLTGTLATGLTPDAIYYVSAGSTTLTLWTDEDKDTPIALAAGVVPSGFVILPQLARPTWFVASPTLVNFTNPLIRCKIKADSQTYTLGSDNLYSYSLSLQEV
jgi:hypothetical protein